MISTNQFKNGTHIEVDGKIMRIIEFQHVKPGKGGAFVRTKLRRIEDGGELGRDLDLVVGAVVHEDDNVTRFVEVLHLAGLGVDGTELLAGAERLVDHSAVLEAAE